MEIDQIKQKINAETTVLMTLKVDNEELVKRKFRSIRDQVEMLFNAVPGGSDTYTKAFDLVQAAVNNEYKQFDESTSHDEKELALIQLRHKSAEVCEILRTA